MQDELSRQMGQCKWNLFLARVRFGFGQRSPSSNLTLVNACTCNINLSKFPPNNTTQTTYTLRRMERTRLGLLDIINAFYLATNVVIVANALN